MFNQRNITNVHSSYFLRCKNTNILREQEVVESLSNILKLCKNINSSLNNTGKIEDQFVSFENTIKAIEDLCK